MGVIRYFPNSFHILPCQRVRKNLKHLRLLSLWGLCLVNLFELSSHELGLELHLLQFSFHHFPRTSPAHTPCTRNPSFSCYPKEGIWAYHYSVNWDLHNRLYRTIEEGFSLKEHAKSISEVKTALKPKINVCAITYKWLYSSVLCLLKNYLLLKRLGSLSSIKHEEQPSCPVCLT